MVDGKSNKEIVKEVPNGVFVRRDPEVVHKYFTQDYIQHNPDIPTGRDAILHLLRVMNKDLKYEMGRVVADGDFVMVHGRYTGWGPKPMVGVDIFRLENGKVTEHWDVLQEEVPTSATKSGNPMFPA